MDIAVKRKDGYVRVNGLGLFYEDFIPEFKKATILCLHGGPGASHDYLLPLADLAKYGYRVLMYDQFGCGRSDELEDKAKFTFDYAVEEAEGVRKKLCSGDRLLLILSATYSSMSLTPSSETKVKY